MRERQEGRVIEGECGRARKVRIWGSSKWKKEWENGRRGRVWGQMEKQENRRSKQQKGTGYATPVKLAERYSMMNKGKWMAWSVCS